MKYTSLKKFLFLLILFFVSCSHGINFSKAILQKLLIKNIAGKTVTLTVEYYIWQASLSSYAIGQQSFNVNHGQVIPVSLNIEKKDKQDSADKGFLPGYIKSVYAEEKSSRKIAPLHIVEDKMGNITVFVRDSSFMFDCLQANFDRALHSEGVYYRDLVRTPYGKYSNGLHYGIFVHPRLPKQFIDTIGKNYQKFYPSDPLKTVKPCKKSRIPKIIHQIWLGPKPLSKDYQNYQKKWRARHPSWQYKLWTDKDVRTMQLINQAAFNKASTYASKADILRLEILYKFGGVYVDMDTEPLEPLDSLAHTFDFFTLLNGPHFGVLLIDVYFTGTKERHPILEQAIKNINHFDKNKPAYYREFGGTKAIRDTMLFGSYSFTQAVFEKIGKGSTRDIILPYYYFGLYTANIFSYAIHYQKLEWIKEKPIVAR